MNYEIFVGLVGLLVSAIAIVSPIVKLNVNIARLSATIECLNERAVTADGRISAHSRILDDHEKRIIFLESRDDG